MKLEIRIHRKQITYIIFNNKKLPFIISLLKGSSYIKSCQKTLVNHSNMGISSEDKLSFELGNDENWLGNHSNLPEDLGKYINITCFEIGFNKFETLPNNIFQDLLKLEEIYINNNKIKEIPKSIGLLKKLEILTINDNPIETIPKELTECANLESFAAINCCLKSLPEEFGNLKNLKFILLNDNNITTLPPSICLLENLYRLELRNNKLKYLPSCFFNLTNLTQLDLTGNSIDEVELNELRKTLLNCDIKI